MKRIAVRKQKAPVRFREPGHPSMQRRFADSFDDRVSESIYDFEDEREVVDAVVPITVRTLN